MGLQGSQQVCAPGTPPPSGAGRPGPRLRIGDRCSDGRRRRTSGEHGGGRLQTSLGARRPRADPQAWMAVRALGAWGQAGAWSGGLPGAVRCRSPSWQVERERVLALGSSESGGQGAAPGGGWGPACSEQLLSCPFQEGKGRAHLWENLHANAGGPFQTLVHAVLIAACHRAAYANVTERETEAQRAVVTPRCTASGREAGLGFESASGGRVSGTVVQVVLEGEGQALGRRAAGGARPDPRVSLRVWGPLGARDPVLWD